MSKNKTKVVIAIIVVIIAILFITIFRLQSSVAVESLSVPSTFASTAPFGQNSLIYSDGQLLNEYNYSNGTITHLSKTVGLGTIDSLTASTDNQYVLFHDQQVTVGGVLANQLQNQKLDPSLDYWWLYSVKNQQFSPLPQNVVLAKLSSNNLYAIVYSDGAESLSSLSLNNFSTINSFSIPGSLDFYPTGNGFLLQTPNNEVIFTQDGTISQILLKSSSLIGYNPNNSTFFVKSTNGSTNLYSFNLPKHLQSLIAKNLIGSPVYLNPGYVLYIAGPNSTQAKIYEYNNTSGKTIVWSLGAGSKLATQGISLVSLLSPNTAVIDTSTTNYLLLGTSLVSQQHSGL